MARPSKYNWEGIEKAYIGGADIDDICKKYKIARKTLQNKIYEKRWEITGNIDADVNEFKAVLGKVTERATQNPETASIYAEKIQTVLEDNKIIQNNRKLLSLAQSIIVRDKDKIKYDNIRTLTGAIKDMEAVANPTANQTNVQVNTQVNNNTLEWDLVDNG